MNLGLRTCLVVIKNSLADQHVKSKDEHKMDVLNKVPKQLSHTDEGIQLVVKHRRIAKERPLRVRNFSSLI